MSKLSTAGICILVASHRCPASRFVLKRRHVSRSSMDNDPTQFVWLFQAPENSGESWHTFRKVDQCHLEKAEADASACAPVVPVNAGRCEVHVQQRLLVNRYTGWSTPVRRGLWYRRGNQGLEPYSESEAAAVEEAYQSLLSGTRTSKESSEPSRTVLLSSGRRVCLMRSSWGGKEIQAMEEDAEASLRSSWFTRIAVQRGFGVILEQPGEVEEELLSENVSHFFIATHGLGEKLARKVGRGLHDSVDALRQNLQQSLLQQAGYRKSDEGPWERPPGRKVGKVPRCDVVSLEWWECLHSDDMDSRLQDITLPSLSIVREMTNSAISDAIFYMQNRARLLESIHSKLEQTVSQIRKHNPGFAGQISLIGHSLGGVILWDLLTAGKALSFTPRALLTLGSPTGLFLHCSGDMRSPLVELSKSVVCYNIFHPLDPVAYRLEPLLAKEMKDLPPQSVPAAGARQEAELLDTPKAAAHLWPFRLNGGRRIDWMLQDDLSVGGAAGAFLQAIPSHLCYFKSLDVAAFLCVDAWSR